MTTEEANVQHYQDQVRQAYADYAEKSKKRKGSTIMARFSNEQNTKRQTA